MHTLVLLSLVAAVAAATLASAIAARDWGRRPARLAVGLLLSAAYWSLLDALRVAAPDPELALAFSRWACLGSFLTGPLAFHLLVTLDGGVGTRLGRAVPLAYGLSLACAPFALASPWVVAGVTATRWGWSPVLGPGVGLVYLAVAICPLSGAACRFFVPRDGEVQRDLRVELAVAFGFVVCTLTEFLLPILEIYGPRLGPASIALWGLVTWGSLYGFRDPIVDPRLFAREILQTLPEGVLLLRLDGRIRAANENLSRLAGRPARDLVGRPIEELLRFSGEELADGEKRECELTDASGRRLPVSACEATLRDPDGHPIGHVLAVRDLREVALLRAYLLTSGRLAAVGQLAAGIAHEINNPISYVSSNLGLLEKHWEKVASEIEKQPGAAAERTRLAEDRELLSETLEGVQRMIGTVREVGGFSGPTGSEPEHSDLGELLDTAVRMTAPQLRDRAAIERRYAKLPPVPCVPQELMQVFMNLLLNAAQSMAERGTIRVVTESAGGLAIVRIEDDGAGISPEVLEWIFDPFFTTKPVGEGTGLGLPISRGIVERHGGTIEVESTPGRGTCFLVQLPGGTGEASS